MNRLTVFCKRERWRNNRCIPSAAFLALLAFLLTAASNPPLPELLGSSPATFRIEGEVRSMPAGSSATPLCQGPVAVLVPGITRCVVYRVHNSMDQAITVKTITMALDPAYPSPPSGCTAEKLLLPSFSGTLQVPAGGHSETPGLPIQLKNTPSNQDDCQQKTLNFTFSGTATYANQIGPAPEQELPTTGAALGGFLLGAGVLGSAGWMLLAAARRRRAKACS
ncbi:hypothetical protein [Arthrobacter sp.]|uniref:hypothetical protein n=1 Tax=Arthrobacter sp. TaxID=1667 RepID=UPI0026DFC663|nr:hypothetical protein [Arthrobacter sp.]MDO5753419.1 hypothetical protein [Arthrobacter sp.]